MRRSNAISGRGHIVSLRDINFTPRIAMNMSVCPLAKLRQIFCACIDCGRGLIGHQSICFTNSCLTQRRPLYRVDVVGVFSFLCRWSRCG